MGLSPPGITHVTLLRIMSKTTDIHLHSALLFTPEEEDDRRWWWCVFFFFFHLSFTVGLHQFAERRMPLDFELHHRAVLSRHLQVDVFVIFSLHSFLKMDTVRERDEVRGHRDTETSLWDSDKQQKPRRISQLQQNFLNFTTKKSRNQFKQRNLKSKRSFK